MASAANKAAAAATARAAAAAVPNNRGMSMATQSQEPLIHKPRGSAGDGYCLIEEMGLVDDKLAYNAIVVCDLASLM